MKHHLSRDGWTKFAITVRNIEPSVPKLYQTYSSGIIHHFNQAIVDPRLMREILFRVPHLLRFTPLRT